MCELTKGIPTELSVRETESKAKSSNTRLIVECRQGPLLHGDSHFGGYIMPIIQAANLMREISYNAQIHRLQEERDGETRD